MILMRHAENMIKRQCKQDDGLKAWMHKTYNAICGLMADSRLRACIRLVCLICRCLAERPSEGAEMLRVGMQHGEPVPAMRAEVMSLCISMPRQSCSC